MSTPNKRAKTTQLVFDSNTNFLMNVFYLLNDDVLHLILKYVGYDSYLAFGLINRRCRQIFELYNIPKKTRFYGYASLKMIVSKTEVERQCVLGVGMAYGIIHFNRRDVLNWTLSARYTKGLIKCICCEAAEAGRQDILEEVFTHSCKDRVKYLQGTRGLLCRCAAGKGHFQLLRYLRKNKCSVNVNSCVAAAEGGHIEILKYLRTQGRDCVWDSKTCQAAAKGGHLSTLQFLREHHCDLEEGCCEAAAEGGHLECLEWLRENGCHVTSEVFIAAARNGHLHCLKWMRDTEVEWHNFGIRWPPPRAFKAAEAAALNKHLHCLRWLRENGVTWHRMEFYIGPT